MGKHPYLQKVINYIAAQSLSVAHLRLFQGGQLIDKWDALPVMPLDQRSITKAVVALAFGCMTVDYGLDTTDSVLSFFPEYAAQLEDTPWQDVQIAHLLTMSHGQPGQRLMADYRRNHREDDWLQFCFFDKFIDRPGASFRYTNTAPYLLGLIMSAQINEPLADYIQRRIFDPLDIPRPTYTYDPDGRFFSGSGIHMSTDDLARLAVAVAESDDEQWVPCQWLKRMTSPIIKTGSSEIDRRHYGYYIWIGRQNSWYMSGVNGQIALYAPEKDLLFCSNGNVPESGKMIQCYWDFVHPTVPTI